jgi:hypothetical protein
MESAQRASILGVMSRKGEASGTAGQSAAPLGRNSSVGRPNRSLVATGSPAFAGDDDQRIEMLESDREKSHRWIAIVGVYQGRE